MQFKPGPKGGPSSGTAIKCKPHYVPMKWFKGTPAPRQETPIFLPYAWAGASFPSQVRIFFLHTSTKEVDCSPWPCWWTWWKGQPRAKTNTSLGHLSFPICFSTFLSLSRSSCSLRGAAASTGTGWREGTERGCSVIYLLMPSQKLVVKNVKSCDWTAFAITKQS